MGEVEIGAAGGKGAGGVGRFAFAEQQWAYGSSDGLSNGGQADMGEHAWGWRGRSQVGIAQQAQGNVEMGRCGV